MNPDDSLITIELEALASTTPFIIRTDKDFVINWASEAVLARFVQAVGRTASKLIEFRNPFQACTPDSVSGRLGEWGEFTFTSGDFNIPLAGKWHSTSDELVFMAIPDPQDAKELSNFAIGDFPANDHLLDLFVSREEAAVSLREARNITQQLKEKNRSAVESGKLLEKKIQETDNQRKAILNMLADMDEAKNKLEASEEKFRALYESSSDAVMLLDEKGYFDCNSATLKMFGYASPEEICGKHPAELSPPTQPCGTDSMTLANERIVTALKNGSNHFEWVHLRSDGESFPAEVLLSKITLGDRDVLQAVIRDITGRKDAEATLQRREQEQRELLNAIQAGIILIDPANREIVECNPAALKMIGGTREQVIGRTCHEFICPSEKEQCLFLDKRVPVESVERELLTIDGRSIPILKTVSRITLAGQDCLLETFVDITEQKRAANELRKLSYAVEQSPSTVVITDIDGNIEYANPKFTELTGYSLDEVIGKNSRTLKSGYTSDEVYKKLWETISFGGTWKGEFHNRKKNGELFWEAASISPMREADGKTTSTNLT